MGELVVLGVEEDGEYLGPGVVFEIGEHVLEPLRVVDIGGGAPSGA